MMVEAVQAASDQVVVPVSNAVILRWLMAFGLILAAAITLSERGRKFLASIRQVGIDKDDADIAELKRKVENLRVLLEEERAEASAARAETDQERSNAAIERRNAESWRRTCSELYWYILAAQRDPSRLKDPPPEPPQLNYGPTFDL